MKTWVRKSLKIGVLAAGMMAFGSTAAQAASVTTHDNWGDASGVVTDTSTQAPVSTCGNAISGAGVALTDGCQGGANATTTGWDSITSFNNYGIGSGLIINLDTQAPVSVCGNSTTVGGSAASGGCAGGANAVIGGGGGGAGGAGQYKGSPMATKSGGSSAAASTAPAAAKPGKPAKASKKATKAAKKAAKAHKAGASKPAVR